MTDIFPPEEFDDWAEDYDQTVYNTQNFPFSGYEAVLDKVVELANVQPDMHVLDLGTGTGNLALRFDALDCDIWGTDFSAAMLAKARLKLPKARLFQFDLREDRLSELDRRFDRIVSAYVFHHFAFDEKVRIIRKLYDELLEPGGSLLLADIAFENQTALEAVKRAAGDEWEDEFYWLANETILALAKIGLGVKFHLVSNCAGVFEIFD